MSFPTISKADLLCSCFLLPLCLSTFIFFLFGYLISILLVCLIIYLLVIPYCYIPKSASLSLCYPTPNLSCVSSTGIFDIFSWNRRTREEDHSNSWKYKKCWIISPSFISVFVHVCVLCVCVTYMLDIVAIMNDTMVCEINMLASCIIHTYPLGIGNIYEII